jgi:multidrug efflux pump subunit AcrA (membrane-fusion protein)
VFEVKPDSRVTQRKVQVGRRTADRIEITGGIDAGTTLVANGAGFLNEGDLVAVKPAAPRQ